MRVIAGSARRLLLKTPKGMDTRPTQDRVKETLFNILQYDLPGCEFLDLYAGSGQMGIEALSRGAKHATFVDFSKESCSCIKANLLNTHLQEQGTVMQSDVLQALSSFPRNITPDIIFMDPPYDHGYERQALECIQRFSIADENTLIIVEGSLHTDISYLDEIGFTLERQKQYKTNQHLFIRLKAEQS